MMKRKVVIPSKPAMRPESEREPRERRRLGLRYDAVTGDGVSGLR